MSRLTDLLHQVNAKDPRLAADLSAEFKVLSGRRAFGLNFERHQPEAVDLPHRKVRKGDKVRVLPSRGSSEHGDKRLWRVTAIERVGEELIGHLSLMGVDEPDLQFVAVNDLSVVAEFRDPIYPGLRSTGKVECGGEKPFHVVINAENYHALQTLLYTHRGTVDAIYIDPPYNTGAKDWKYNNDYVDGEDDYRHSKWLAFMERRLKLAKELLNPDDSALVITIDEKEYLRLGLLLEQLFPEAQIQMVSSVINPKGTSRTAYFSRVDEYLYFVFFGSAKVMNSTAGGEATEVRWRYLRRNDMQSVRATRPNQFYPIYISSETSRIVHMGDPLGPDDQLDGVPVIQGAVPVFPIQEDGIHMNWGLTAPSLAAALQQGFVRVTSGAASNSHQSYTISYLTAPNIKKTMSGDLEVTGTRKDGSKVVVLPQGKVRRASTVWKESSHDAGAYGTSIVSALLGGRRFPFPKSLYAVEDALRYIVKDKPDATVVDFFSGSGTTAHAVMRLNHQDGGRRQSISVTNNEVSAEEQTALRLRGLRPGDSAWEELGICEYITKPRIQASITGRTPIGLPVKGDYKFSDEFPMAQGFCENVEFFELTYETQIRVSHNRSFASVAPLLWMRAGGRGRRIDVIKDGWEVAETYGIVEDLDESAGFVGAVHDSATVRMVFIVTNDDRRFQMIANELPSNVEAVRLYESYVTNFEINTGGNE